MNQQPQDCRAMTAQSMGRDLLHALLAELRLLPKPWEQLAKDKQDDVIERLRKRVDTNVKMAVHLLAADGRTTVAGALEQITIKDGVKAVVKFSALAPNLHELYDVSGKEVLIVVASADDYTGGMDEVVGEDDQRGLDLGHEYHENDGGGMQQDGDIVDAEFVDVPTLPAPGDTEPTEEELDKAFDAGYDAAEQGQPESACPVMAGALCIEWVKGWKAYHEQLKDKEESAIAEKSASHGAIARYRHPDEPSLTWTGRGRKPVWVAEWLAGGGTLEDLEINDQDE